MCHSSSCSCSKAHLKTVNDPNASDSIGRCVLNSSPCSCAQACEGRCMRSDSKTTAKPLHPQAVQCSFVGRQQRGDRQLQGRSRDALLRHESDIVATFACSQRKTPRHDWAESVKFAAISCKMCKALALPGLCDIMVSQCHGKRCRHAAGSPTGAAWGGGVVGAQQHSTNSYKAHIARWRTQLA